MRLLIQKSFIAAHSRTLASGKVVSVSGYTNARAKRAADPKKARQAAAAKDPGRFTVDMFSGGTAADAQEHDTREAHTDALREAAEKHRDKFHLSEAAFQHVLERPRAYAALIETVAVRKMPGWWQKRYVGIQKEAPAYDPELRKAHDGNPNHDQKTGRFASGGGSVFHPDKDEADAFRAGVDKLMGSLRTLVHPLTVGHVPAVLRATGAPDLPIEITRDTIRKATNGNKHDVPLEAIKRLPEELADPVAVFQSKTHGVVVLTELKDAGDRPVVVAVHLGVGSRGNVQVNRIASAYGRDAGVQGWVDDGLLLYVNTKKNRAMPGNRGLQLPKAQHDAVRGSSVLTEADIVKPHGGDLTKSQQVERALQVLRWHVDEPTAEQKASGDYPKKRRDWHGLTLAIEHPEGTVREGVDETGKAWRTVFKFAYGEILGTMGMDGDPVDVFIGQHPAADHVYIVQQMKRKQWDTPDEQKVFIDFASESDAKAAYLAHYDDPRFFGGIKAMPVDEFIRRVRGTKKGETMIKAKHSAARILFLKAFVKGHTRRLKSGQVVQVGPYHTKTPGAHHEGNKTADMFATPASESGPTPTSSAEVKVVGVTGSESGGSESEPVVPVSSRRELSPEDRARFDDLNGERAALVGHMIPSAQRAHARAAASSDQHEADRIAAEADAEFADGVGDYERADAMRIHAGRLAEKRDKARADHVAAAGLVERLHARHAEVSIGLGGLVSGTENPHWDVSGQKVITDHDALRELGSSMRSAGKVWMDSRKVRAT